MVWYKKKKIIIPVVLLAILVTLRLALEPIIHKRLNAYLLSFSPALAFHIEDLDLNIIKGGYTFEGVKGALKSNNKDFLTVERIYVSIAWREIFDGKVVTDIDVSNFDFSFNDTVKEAFTSVPEKKKNATEVRDTLFPVKIERVRVSEGKITMDDYPSLEDNKKFHVSKIRGEINNLTPDSGRPFSPFDLEGTIFQSNVLKLSGNLKTLDKPISWDIDTELHDFNLLEANKFLRRKVPLTFTKGKLDLFAEAKSEKGKVEGYVKPFMKDADIMNTKEDLEGSKHWMVEVLTALGNLLLRTSDTKTVATKIPFSFDKEGMHVDSGEALNKALEHGFKEKLTPEIENVYNLKLE